VSAGVTPSQTVGPYLAIALPWADGPYVVPPETPGAIVITGTVRDGAGEPIPDALVETWQADPDSRFNHPDDPRGAAEPAVAAFRGFGRCPTDAAGRYWIVTLPPGPLPAPDGGMQAPHIDVSVFARGLLNRVVTRIYLPDEDANAADPVLSSIKDPARRATLVAVDEPAADANGSGAAGQAPAAQEPVGPPAGMRGQVTDPGRWPAGRPATTPPAGLRRFRFDVRLQGEGETVFFDV
jgi:protocatechuate 3,4-dioxygenase, alpha subunit